MRGLRVGLIAGLMLMAQAASAHVPTKCGAMFLLAGQATDRVVKAGNAASIVADEGLSRAVHLTADDYVNLVAAYSTLIAAQTSMFTTLQTALECVAE